MCSAIYKYAVQYISVQCNRVVSSAIILLGPRQRLPGRVEEVLGSNRGQQELHQVIMTGRGSMSRHGLNMSKDKGEGRRNLWGNLL